MAAIESPGRARMNASQNAFAQRMMDKPKCESLNSDPSYRIFYDPPELIQMAFGGREWFQDVGNYAVSRVGLFKGLTWYLSALIVRQEERGINRVRITARPKRPGQEEQLYDMEFLCQPEPGEGADASDPLPQSRVITHRPGIVAANLKAVYAEVLGEHAI